MEPIDFYCRLYEKLQHREGEIKCIMRPLRRIIRMLARNRIERYYNNRVRPDIARKRHNVIVSLTSFPGRISIVHLVIHSLLRQTYLPKKIILWLSKEQFKNVPLPEKLRELESDVFEIRMVNGDLRSYKKSAYVLKEFPNERVFLVDDDLFYPTNTIEDVLKSEEGHRDSIICRFGSIMKYKDGKPDSYNSWWDEMVEASCDPNLFFGTGGGTLLRRDLLYDDVDNMELALSLAPNADDIWMNAMVNLKGTPKFKLKYGLILPIYQRNSDSLASKNVGESKNDVQIANVREYYINNFNKDPFKYRV